MLQLTGTSDLIRVVTSAAADIEVHASWVDNNAGTITPGRTNTASIVTATTTTIVGSPSANIQRRVVSLSLRNNHASTSCDITVDHTDGTNADTLIKVTLLAGEALIMDSEGEWHHFDSSGNEYQRSVAMATRSEMESASSLVVGVSPGIMRYHPGIVKAWASIKMINGVPLLVDGYNLESITDTAAGQMSFDFVENFANANYCLQALIERTSTSLTATNLKYCNIRFGSQIAAGALIEVYDGTATTHVQEDPNAYCFICLGDAA
jgi:hypothetical protein